MKVKLINPAQAKLLFEDWGEVASVCYDTETSTPETIGKNCKLTQHFSGSRGDYIKFKITEVPRFTVDQAVRHSIGTFMNVGSFRYINKGIFCYEIPEEITDNEELLNEYCDFMENSGRLYEKIQSYVFTKTGKKERANEQARYVLPMSTHTSFVMGFTVEALIHFMNMRLCIRAEDVIRNMAVLMKTETLKVIPELEKDLAPSCQALLWCPEGKRGCGAYPTKKELQQMLKEYRGIKNGERENL